MGVILGLYRGYIGIMENKMETTGIIGVIWGEYSPSLVTNSLNWIQIQMNPDTNGPTRGKLSIVL